MVTYVSHLAGVVVLPLACPKGDRIRGRASTVFLYSFPCLYGTRLLAVHSTVSGTEAAVSHMFTGMYIAYVHLEELNSKHLSP